MEGDRILIMGEVVDGKTDDILDIVVKLDDAFSECNRVEAGPPGTADPALRQKPLHMRPAVGCHLPRNRGSRAVAGLRPLLRLPGAVSPVAAVPVALPPDRRPATAAGRRWLRRIARFPSAHWSGIFRPG